MNLYESSEDYLETILMIKEEKGYVKSIDIAEHLHFSKPSVSIAMKKLSENGYITIGKNGHIELTEEGYNVAAKTYDRHKILTKVFVLLGIDKETAAKDACKVEHDLSEETFQAIKRYIDNK
jgi:Mn-dependent DtxR family transcriptional regulator